MRRPFLVFALVVLTVVGLDQASKAFIRSMLPAGASIPVVPGWLYLTHVRNEGAAFGLLQGRQPFFVFVTILVLIGIGVYWWRSSERARPTAVVIAIGLVAGGAIGNLIDRVYSSRVTDFIEVAIINFPVFNVADSAIVCGTAVLVTWLLFGAPESGSGGTDPHDERSASDEPGPHPQDASPKASA